MLRLLQQQHGRCPLCGTLLLHAEQEPHDLREWEQWLRVVRKALTKQFITVAPDPARTGDPRVVLRLLHAHCAREGNTCTPASTDTAPAHEPSGLA